MREINFYFFQVTSSLSFIFFFRLILLNTLFHFVLFFFLVLFFFCFRTSLPLVLFYFLFLFFRPPRVQIFQTVGGSDQPFFFSFFLFFQFPVTFPRQIIGIISATEISISNVENSSAASETRVMIRFSLVFGEESHRQLVFCWQTELCK